MEKNQQTRYKWAAFLPLFIVLIASQINSNSSMARLRNDEASRAMKSWVKADRAICEALAKRLPEETRKQIYFDYFIALGNEFDASKDENEAYHQKYISPRAFFTNLAFPNSMRNFKVTGIPNR